VIAQTSTATNHAQSGPRGPAMAKVDRWTIIDPNLKTNDISAGTNQARLIEGKFRDACSALKDRMQQLERLDIAARKGQSVLGCLIGGNYAAFSSQRARLNDIFVNTMAAQDGARE
jgi:non-canonical poly(A) RNA polymerase PAPD5/7